jgi:SAM-dependent methyltransferase
MHPTAREAAKAIRHSLSSAGLAPPSFRAALDQVEPRDRDTWFDLVWDSDELPEDDPRLPPGCVPYLPCGVATVLEAMRAAEVTGEDVFVDVGAGLGRVVALVHLLTGAGCIGLEIQPALVAAARARATSLDLDRLRFIEGDAADRMRCVTAGTVFFLYCPFGGSRLQRLLGDLESLARTRPIRICCVGMAPLGGSWLSTIASDSADLTVYRSRPHSTHEPAP